jgi:hypothetical protein
LRYKVTAPRRKAAGATHLSVVSVVRLSDGVREGTGPPVERHSLALPHSCGNGLAVGEGHSHFHAEKPRDY